MSVEELLKLATQYQNESDDWWKRGISLIPESIDDYCDKGWKLYMLGSYEEAIKAFEQVIKSNPRHWDAYKGKLFCFRDLKRSEEEKQQIESILQEAQQIQN